MRVRSALDVLRTAGGRGSTANVQQPVAQMQEMAQFGYGPLFGGAPTRRYRPLRLNGTGIR